MILVVISKYSSDMGAPNWPPPTRPNYRLYLPKAYALTSAKNEALGHGDLNLFSETGYADDCAACLIPPTSPNCRRKRMRAGPLANASSRTNANYRLPRASLGRVEGGDGIVEGRYFADVRPQSSVRTRWTISLSWARSDSTTKSTAKPSAGRASAGPTTDTSIPPARIRPADRFWMSPPMTSNTRSTPPTSSKRVVVEVNELLRAEVERLLTVGRASGADDVGAGFPRELRHHRPDCAGRAVREDALPGLKAAVLEQSLPRREAGDWQARAHREVDVARQRREVTRLDGYIFRQGAVAMPVGEAEHALSHRQPRRAIAEDGDHSGQFVAGDRRCSVTVTTIGPVEGHSISRDESDA